MLRRRVRLFTCLCDSSQIPFGRARPALLAGGIAVILLAQFVR
jgi:hypothetical protein